MPTQDEEQTRWFEKYIKSMETDIQEIKQCIQALPKTLEEKYVTKVEYSPVKAIAYGLVAVIMTGVLMAFLKLVIIK